MADSDDEGGLDDFSELHGWLAQYGFRYGPERIWLNDYKGLRQLANVLSHRQVAGHEISRRELKGVKIRN